MMVKCVNSSVVLLAATAATLTSASLTPSHQSTMRLYPRNSDQSSILFHHIHQIRGGDTGEGSATPGLQAPGQYNYGVPPQQQQQQQTQMDAPTSIVPPTSAGEYNMGGAPADPMYEYRETVEDRIDAWRKQQQQLQQTQSVEQAASAIDEQGRFKLFTTVSRVSVSFFFFILMWRTVHHYELADATLTGNTGGIRAALVRTIVVTPLVVLFLGELMGAVLGMTGGNIGGSGNASHATKKRLKGILNLHKGVELVMMLYNVIRLAVLPSKYVPREVYIGRTISNFFFLMQAQLYTKLSWDDVSKSAIGEGGYVTESYYDDYTPEMDMVGRYQDEASAWQSSTGDGYYDQAPPMPQQQQGMQQQYQPKSDENSTGWT